jgi:TfoX/Sxy family transcriptional regulator of competence genes
MAYDTKLGERLREKLKGTRGLVEKKMFGGVGFMINWNMACGVLKDDLIVRVGTEKHNEAMKRPHVKPFDNMGKPMAGWVLVSPEGSKTDKALSDWIKTGVEFAKSLPPK